MALSGVGCSGERLQELPHSFPISGLSGYDSSDESLEGFPDSGTDPESALSRRRVHLLWADTSHVLAVSPRHHVFHVRSGSRSPAPDALLTAAPQRCGSSGFRGGLDLLGRLSSLQDLRWWSIVGHLEVGVPLDLPRPDLLLFTDASDSSWGALLGDDHLSGL